MDLWTGVKGQRGATGVRGATGATGSVVHLEPGEAANCSGPVGKLHHCITLFIHCLSASFNSFFLNFSQSKVRVHSSMHVVLINFIYAINYEREKVKKRQFYSKQK